METNQSIEHVLENMDKNIVYRTKSPLLPAILLLIAGIAFFIVNSSFDWSSSSIYPPLFLSLGSISIVIGILKCSFRKDYYVSAGNHQRLRVHEIYFDVSERDRLNKLIENGNLSEINKLKGSVSSGLRLRLLSTKDMQICFSQIIAFVTFEDVNINAPKQHTIAETEILIDLKRQIK